MEPWSVRALSLILAVCRHAEEVGPGEEERVEAGDVLRASTLLAYFKAHARKVYGRIASPDPDETFAADFGEFLEAHGNEWEASSEELRRALGEHGARCVPESGDALTKKLVKLAGNSRNLDVRPGWTKNKDGKSRRILRISVAKSGVAGVVGGRGGQRHLRRFGQWAARLFALSVKDRGDGLEVSVDFVYEGKLPDKRKRRDFAAASLRQALAALRGTGRSRWALRRTRRGVSGGSSGWSRRRLADGRKMVLVRKLGVPVAAGEMPGAHQRRRRVHHRDNLIEVRVGERARGAVQARLGEPGGVHGEPEPRRARVLEGVGGLAAYDEVGGEAQHVGPEFPEAHDPDLQTGPADAQRLAEGGGVGGVRRLERDQHAHGGHPRSAKIMVKAIEADRSGLHDGRNVPADTFTSSWSS